MRYSFSIYSRKYVEEALSPGQIINIDDSQTYHHLKNVLRLSVGSNLRLFNGIDGEFIASIVDIKKHSLLVQIGQRLRVSKQSAQITLGISIIKLDRMLDAIGMAVQLGCASIIPFIAARSQMNSIKIDRFTKSIIEATEQSERLNCPTLAPTVKLSEYKNYANFDTIIYANEDESGSVSMRSLMGLSGNVLALVGPEGGFTKEELSMLSSLKNARSVSLGENILRSETAIAALLAQINLMYEA